MPRRLLKRYLPDPVRLREHPYLKHLGGRMHDPNLWHLNRRSISGGFALGMFCAFLPIPFEMVVAAVGAALLRVNLPISVALVWVSNPFTWLPLYGGAYLLGAWLMGLPPVSLHDITLKWLMEQFVPLWLGCLLTGSVLALVSYVVVRLAWEWNIRRSWSQRRVRRNQ